MRVAAQPGLSIIESRSESWSDGAAASEGFTALACRSATVTQWIAESVAGSAHPLCVGGGSGGAAQTSYMMT